MREGVLFELTKGHLESGLQGIPVGYCVTSHVDPKKGLSYAGRPISGLVSKTLEEVIYLLYHGEMGTKEQVSTFTKELKSRSICSKEVVEQIYSLPKTNSSMDSLSTAILIAGMIEGKNDYVEDCLDLIAKTPHIAACVINSSQGKETPNPNPELGYSESFAKMLHMGEEFASALRLFTLLNFDHGGGNLSAFVGKAVSSSLENMYGCIASSMASLGGSRQGGAIRAGFDFVSKAGEHPEGVEEALKKGSIPGFGHAILEAEDPRARICYEYCQKHFPENPFVKKAVSLRSEILQKSSLHPNLDAISGVMLHASGLEDLGIAPILFGASRVVGIAIQIVYERIHAKEGKGTPIMRPAYIYKHRS